MMGQQPARARSARAAPQPSPCVPDPAGSEPPKVERDLPALGRSPCRPVARGHQAPSARQPKRTNPFYVHASRFRCSPDPLKPRPPAPRGVAPPVYRRLKHARKMPPDATSVPRPEPLPGWPRHCGCHCGIRRSPLTHALFCGWLRGKSQRGTGSAPQGDAGVVKSRSSPARTFMQVLLPKLEPPSPPPLSPQGKDDEAPSQTTSLQPFAPGQFSPGVRVPSAVISPWLTRGYVRRNLGAWASPSVKLQNGVLGRSRTTFPSRQILRRSKALFPSPPWERVPEGRVRVAAASATKQASAGPA